MKLSLPNFDFTERSFGLFMSYFEKCMTLEELQISNVKSVRLNDWYKFMQILAHNKTLRDLDLSWNNFIEDQRAALLKLQNPYRVFKIVHKKWLKMGAGAPWPPIPTLEQL